MQLFFYVAFVLVTVVAILAIQNSHAPQVTVEFLNWQFETSLVLKVLGSILAGAIVALFLWIPKAVRASRRIKELNGEIRNLEAILHREVHYQSGAIKTEPVEAKTEKKNRQCLTPPTDERAGRILYSTYWAFMP